MQRWPFIDFRLHVPRSLADSPHRSAQLFAAVLVFSMPQSTYGVFYLSFGTVHFICRFVYVNLRVFDRLICSCVCM